MEISRYYGFELELLAPEGLTRLDLANSIAQRTGGTVLHALHYSSPGRGPDGRPICHLEPSQRVEVDGADYCEVVGDDSIRPEPSDGPAGLRILTDDVRLALLIRRLARAETADAPALLAPYAEIFGGYFEQSDGRAMLRDRFGHGLAAIGAAPAERARVAEVVTRPLERSEVLPTLSVVLGEARRLGFEVPREAALHVHLDAAPWQSTACMKALLTRGTDELSAARDALGTNPLCRHLGPPPSAVRRVAETAPASLPWPTLAAALGVAGASKHADLNVLGVIQARPVQPTLEVRMLGMSLDPDQLMGRFERLEAILSRVMDDLGSQARSS